MKEIIIDEVIYYIGRNIKDNDELFKKMSNDSEWFHSEDSPSSHVYCVCKKLGPKEIKQSAQFVRQYSKSQGSVIHIKKRNLLRKGPGLLEIIGNNVGRA